MRTTREAPSSSEKNHRRRLGRRSHSELWAAVSLALEDIFTSETGTNLGGTKVGDTFWLVEQQVEPCRWPIMMLLTEQWQQ